MTSGRRINARLTAAVAGKVAALRSRTRKSTSAIVVEALNRYCDELEHQGGEPAEILARNAFIGCEAGPKDLARRYKAHLSAGLRKKA
jgi:hypothetical protein